MDLHSWLVYPAKLSNPLDIIYSSLTDSPGRRDMSFAVRLRWFLLLASTARSPGCCCGGDWRWRFDLMKHRHTDRLTDWQQCATVEWWYDCVLHCRSSIHPPQAMNGSILDNAQQYHWHKAASYNAHHQCFSKHRSSVVHMKITLST